MAEPSDIIALGCTRSYARGERPGWHYRVEDGEFECYDTWNVPRAVLTSFLDLVAGTVEVIGGTSARRIPLKNTDFVGALAVDVSGDDEGWDRTANTPSICKAKINYRVPAYPIDGDDAYIRKSTASGTRAMQLPSSAINGPYPIPYPVPTIIWQFELVNLAEAPVEDWAAYGGYINSVPWRNQPAGCVKFIPPASFEQRTVAGGRQYQATFGFDICRIPWDNEYGLAGTLYNTTFPPSIDFESVLGL